MAQRSGIWSREPEDGQPVERIVASQRERLLAAIVAAVAADGYRATTVGEICRRAGVSRATFYEFFDDKENCFLAAYEELDRRLQEYVAARLERVEGVVDRVRAGMHAFLGGLASGEDATRVAVVEVMGAGARARERYQRSVYAFVPVVEQARDLVPGGHELPRLTSKVVVSAIAATIFQEVLAGHVGDLPRLLPELVYLALVPFVGREAALAARDATTAEAPPEEPVGTGG